MTPRLRHVVFVSGGPLTRGHIYRVRHPMGALSDAGCRASCIGVADVDKMLESLLPADLVVIFRAAWSPEIESLFSRCRASATPVCFDIDDLLFDREYMTVDHIDMLRLLSDSERAEWQQLADGFLRTLEQADFVTVTTRALVAAVQTRGKPVYLVPNGFDRQMLACADALVRERHRSAVDKCVRVGYASGTRTHQRDFAEAVPALVRVMADRPGCVLTLVGELDLKEFPELTPFMERLEVRPLVPHEALAGEYARFDINLAPLNIASPFCQAKSEIKFTEAALVEVPTVASTTEPFAAAIHPKQTGFVAATTADWYRHLLYLVDRPDERRRIGTNARREVIETFGPDSKSRLVPRVYAEALSGLQRRSP